MVIASVLKTSKEIRIQSEADLQIEASGQTLTAIKLSNKTPTKSINNEPRHLMIND